MNDAGRSPAVALQCLHEWLAHWATSRPDAEAVVDRERRLNYAELRAAVDECAAAMMASGVRHGDRVATLATPGADFMIMFLAAASIGAIWVGLNPRYADTELAEIVARIEPRLVAGPGAIEGRSYVSWLEALPDTVNVVALDVPSGGGRIIGLADFLARARELPGENLQLRRRQVLPADPCLIVFTSGSTGTPKGAMICHAALTGASVVQFRVWPVEPLRILNNLPINHIGCVGDLTCYTLIGGGTIIFSSRFDPADTLLLLSKERATAWGQVPTMFQLTLDSPGFDAAKLQHLQYIFWGGAHASRELVARLHELCPRLATSYGQTETVGSVAFTPPDATLEMLATTVGRAVPPYQLRIVTLDGRTAAAGESGEVQVRTPFGMSGYWRDPQASAVAVDAEGWRSTGDVGVLTAEGDLQLRGRVHDVFKSGGYNVYPPEIEAALESHSAVRQASVVGAPDALFGAVAVAFIVPHAAPPDEQELRAYLRERLANYKIPKRFYFLDELPRLPVGKIDKQALREQAALS